jgi:hypothetical protein
MSVLVLYVAAALAAFVAWVLAKLFPRLAIVAGMLILARCCYYVVAGVALVQGHGTLLGRGCRQAREGFRSSGWIIAEVTIALLAASYFLKA